MITNIDERRLNEAIEHARISVTEIQNETEFLDPSVSVRPIHGTEYKYTIHIDRLNARDMSAFMNWFREIKPDWLEGLEQGYNDGWSRG